MLSSEEHRVLALAAIAQCAKLVQSIARSGSASAESIADSLAGIIVLDESDPEIAIGGAKAVALGLSDLTIKRADPLLMERVRTITALIHLEKLLRRDPHTQRGSDSNSRRLSAHRILPISRAHHRSSSLPKSIGRRLANWGLES